MYRVTLALLFTLLSVSSPANAWWNDSWNFRKEIVIDAAKLQPAVTEALEDVPILLRLHTGNFGYFFDVKEGGADLRVIAGDDQTPLKFDVEHWDPINELGYLWVRLPRLAAGGKASIYLYYGNPLAPAAAEPAAVSDDETLLRLHFADKGTPRDSTAYANHPDRASAEVVPTALIGPGLSLAPGTGLSIPSAPSLTVAAQTGFTLTMWLRPGASGSSAAAGNAAASFGAGPGEAPVAAGNVAAGSDSGSSSAGASTATTDVGSDSATTPGSAGSEMVLRMVAPGEPLLFRASDGSSQLSLSAGADGLQLALRSPALPEPLRLAPVPLTSGAWQHVAVVLSAERLTLYLNGREGSSAALGADGAGLGFQAALQIGGGAFAGQIDELSLSGKARSADWLAFNASNQGPQDVLLSYGTDQSPQSAGGGAHASNFGIIFQSVFGNPEAIVEQSVIILCALMATIALLVMFFKWLFLMRAQGASRRFARAFQKLHAEQHVGDDTQRPVLEGLYESRRRFADSPLFRVYRIGIDEVRSRMGSTVGAQAAGLDGKALTSVRAAMDSAMVRERQRMDSQMVLLTIAISGGPFIGLLGTVVGVMVTFAAIAQAGDVNITAIAPGMAAALLATVAGLGVAIPALFGYNYLGSRIKDLSADMHVFADELLSRINEIYGR